MSNSGNGLFALFLIGIGMDFVPKWMSWITLVGFIFVGCMFYYRKLTDKKNNVK